MPKTLTKREAYFKKARTEAMAWLGKMYGLENALAGGGLTMEKRSAVERRLRWLHGALDLLPEEERRMLLCIAEGCTIDDLCGLFAREKSSVYAVRKRAIDHLAGALYGCWEDGWHRKTDFYL